MNTTHTGNTTQKSNLLAIARTDLDMAREAFDAAANKYQHSHSIADRAEMVEMFNKLQAVEAQYTQAYKLLAARQLARMV